MIDQFRGRSTLWLTVRCVSKTRPVLREKIKPSEDELRRRKDRVIAAEAKLEELRPGTTKQLDAVLRNEANVYRTVGRRVGGLGTIYLTYGGRRVVGVGTESCKPGHPGQQFVIEDPNDATFDSENHRALAGLWKQLDNPVRTAVADYLVARMDGEGEFPEVGYFMLYVLWQFGRFADAATALPSLCGTKADYSISEGLRLLGGLLRYRHIDFDDTDLDLIEQTIATLDKNESLFGIPEKIAAIRTKRLGS